MRQLYHIVMRPVIQALPFYMRHGYSVFGVIEDMPRGHQRYFLKKALSQ